MRRLLFDLEVVLDVLLAREPHLAASAAAWAAVERGRVDGVLPAHGLPTIFYLAAKVLGREQARRVVDDLLSVFAVAAIDDAVIRRAAGLGLADFEDAVVAAAAEADGCALIVSRDPAGFAGSPVAAVTPAELLAMLDDEVQEVAPTYSRRRRRSLGLRPDDQLIAETTPEGLLLRPAVTLPLEVYTDERVREFDQAEAELAAVMAAGAKGKGKRAPR